MIEPAGGKARAAGPVRTLVLVGAGHAHAQVLHEFAERRPENLAIVLISPSTRAPYSGMVPAWLAGDYTWDECCIDFTALCERAGARVAVDQVVGIDPANRQLLLASGTHVDYDWLSLNIGSTLHAPHSDHLQVVPMRPLTALNARWQGVLDAVGRRDDDTTRKTCDVVMIGGGAAGIESMLAAHHRLTTIAPRVRFRFTLATQGEALIPGLSPAAGRHLQTHLRRRGVTIRTGFAASAFGNDAVLDSGGQSIPADVVLWATGAQAFDWPRAGGLATDERGFIRIDAMLRSISHPEVFATGDCASWADPLPKAGVYAVRMGPVLARNLRAAVEATAKDIAKSVVPGVVAGAAEGAVTGTTMQAYVPQRRYLVLVGTGDRHAVASWGPLGWQGAWVYQWKQRIDRRFLARYNPP